MNIAELIAQTPISQDKILSNFVNGGYGVYFDTNKTNQNLIDIRAQTGVGLGALAIKANLTSFEYLQDSKVTQSPQEAGSFNSSDKVQSPILIKLKMVANKSSNGTELIANLARLVKQTSLYKIVTPKGVFKRMDVTKFSYMQKTEEGLTLIEAAVEFTEIRTVSRQVTEAVSPNGQEVLQNGLVQAVPL